MPDPTPRPTAAAIPEADWRTLRALHAQALERYCARVLRDVAAVLENGRLTSHARYLNVYELVHERDKRLARILNDLRRSTALDQLALMCRDGLVSADEMARFSEPTRARVKFLVEGL